MKRPALKRPTPSMAVSIAALVVALGGTSYAAATIGNADIENNAINAPKIANGTIGSADLRNGSVRGIDLAPGIRRGPQGPAGADGQTGAAGPAGAGRWVLVGTDGKIADQSGGFTLVAGYPTLPNTAVAPAPDNSLRANGNVYIDAGSPIADSGLVASIVLQNTVNQDGGDMAGRTDAPDANAEFSGEISVSACNVGAPTTPPSGPTNCAPAGAQNANSFVVSPRNSDGTFTTDTKRKAFYVIVTG